MRLILFLLKFIYCLEQKECSLHLREREREREREAASVRDHRNDAGSQLLNGHHTRPPKQSPLSPSLSLPMPHIRERRKEGEGRGGMKCLHSAIIHFDARVVGL